MLDDLRMMKCPSQQGHALARQERYREKSKAEESVSQRPLVSALHDETSSSTEASHRIHPTLLRDRSSAGKRMAEESDSSD